MQDFRKGAQKKHTRTRTIITILTPVFFLLAYSVISVYGKSADVVRKDRDAHAMLAELQARQDQLSGQIEKLHTDAGVETVIRDKYRAVKEGEGVVVIVDDQADTQTLKSQDKGFWQSVKDWFIKK